jgi:transposase
MKYTQNEKIRQITPETLIVGVDVASEVHYARAFDFRGIEYGKVISFTNDSPGFKSFLDWILELSQMNKKTSVMVGMEPTGHYWFNLAQYLDNYAIKTVLVNPFHVKRSKELDDNNPTKNDRKDPKTIALLVKDGRYMIPYIPKGLYSELRTAMETRWRIAKRINGVANRVKRWLSIYFPEFGSVFANWEGKTALVCLREFPTPKQVLGKGVAGIVKRWREDKIRGEGVKRATRLFEAAESSVGFREGLLAAQQELITLLEEYGLLKRQEEQVMALVEKTVMQIPGSRQLLKIKGVGIITVAGFLAEVGDVTRFSHPKQIQKYAGLNIKENSSGKHKGSAKITKRGRRSLRAILFRAIMPLVAKNAEFKELHKYYTNRAEKPLKKKQSLIALMCKLIRIFYAILTKDVAYDPEKMMNDIHRPVLQEAA